MFRQIGRVEAGVGRELGTLQTAMHVGARVMWHRLSDRLLELEVQIALRARRLIAGSHPDPA